MRFSYNWISELVEGLDALPSELSTWITLKTAESEGVENYAPHFKHVVVARVVAVEPIEGSKNVKATVDCGALGTRVVVCGAKNCRSGILTAYVPPGTALGSKEILKAVVSGIESEGMLASGSELGLNRDDDGIMELAGLECGAPLGLVPDSIIEIDNKSLTHRPDLWGHHGMAREVAAILHKPLREPARIALLPAGEAPIAISIDDFSLCPRYSAVVVESVTVGPSPLWLQYRLEAIGLNPINNVVDVTNFVMAELGQPMHAFDADKLRGAIRVRSGIDGEAMPALNGETYQVGPSNLLITDDNGPIAIAGVIGGQESAIGSGTTRIVFESANFHPGSVRKTSSALKLRTDASMRFEKSQDPANTVRGLARALELLQEVSPGARVMGGVADAAGPRPSLPSLALPLEWLDRKLGRHVASDEVRGILTALQFGVTEEGLGVLRVDVPSWRATKDISCKEDLVEEIGRMIGYSAIPPVAPLLPAKVPPPNKLRQLQQELRLLISARGFHEVYNYSFLSEDTVRRFGMDADAHVRVLNPIASDQNLMRTSLVPGVAKNVVDNSRYSDTFRLFELGVEIHKVGGGLPREVNCLAAAIFHKDGDANGLFELIQLAQSIASAVEVRAQAIARSYEHPARVAELYVEDVMVGRVFELHPAIVEKGRASVLTMNVDAVLGLRSGAVKFRSLQRFPSSAFDLSVIAPARALVGDLQRELRGLAGERLDSIEFVRQYSGTPLVEGTKSVSFRITLSAPDRTLESDEVGSIRQRMIDGMRAFGFELRV